ncbi:MAG: tryptophan synthase subunit alpha [Ilumatobacteraceae bacterium]|nr:tryptophan synthase subunit alpha [Ilumatobacteraceae bacterium]
MNLESHLRAQRSAGRKLLVPYVTGGLLNWKEAIRVAAACGADAIEVGIPFSDPVMDGPVIQEASLRALKDGATPFGIIQEISTLEIDIPIAVMLYYNTVFRAGHERFATSLVKNGVSAAIAPDLPLEEAGEWCRDADAAGVETIMLAAPTAPDSRLPLVVERARGFVYAVGLLGITGERDSLASTATVLAGRLKNITDKPVLIGVGVSNAEQAYEACKIADGVIQGASVVRRLMESGPDAVGEYITEVRAAIDTP